MPELSLITACYNSTQFIRRLASSLAKQTTNRFEWICVDDCSTDDTIDILVSIRTEFKAPMKIYRLPVNSGGGLALGVGVAMAEAPCVSIIDHDDELLPSAVETALRDWSGLAQKQVFSGIFYRTIDPSTGKKNGSDFKSNFYPYTYLAHRIRAHSEFWPVIDRAILLRCLPLDVAEKFCLWGPILEDIANNAPFYYNSACALRVYHRDNSLSQTNYVRISRKTVWTYARMFQRFDAHKLRAPIHYLRLLLALMRFSHGVYGSPWSGVNQIELRWVRLMAYFLAPFHVFMCWIRPLRSLVVIKAPECNTHGLLARIETF
jgi:glycosyltransferase involved in cell wall biosynthesis